MSRGRLECKMDQLNSLLRDRQVAGKAGGAFGKGSKAGGGFGKSSAGFAATKGGPKGGYMYVHVYNM